MPTGYTASLIDGTIKTFPEFAKQCARAFGAYITERDTPLSAEVPSEFKPSDYHLNGHKEAVKKLKKLSKLDKDARIRRGQKALNKSIKSYKKYIADAAKIKKILVAMKEKVEKWNPPTEDHLGVKKFMLEQLDSTIQHDGEASYYHKALKEYSEMDPLEHFKGELDNAVHDIKYHLDGYNKEVETINKRNKWIKDLMESIDNAK